MCDTLRNTRSRGRSAVPLIRLRCRKPIRVRRSLVVLIFIVSYQLPVPSSQLPAASHQCHWELETGTYLAPVFPAFFFSCSPV
jgi:hypothetical protein